jgi:hypothetical protein
LVFQRQKIKFKQTTIGVFQHHTKDPKKKPKRLHVFWWRCVFFFVGFLLVCEELCFCCCLTRCSKQKLNCLLL